MSEEKKKTKLSEKISLMVRRKWLLNRTKTFLIVAILILAYIILNLWIQELDLPKIDVTENKIYTLSDASKKAVSQIEKDVKIYVYGVEEKSSFIDLLKQYNKTCEKITYERITEESNYEMVTKYGLENNYVVVIIKSSDSEKIIDYTEFSSYDYTTGQSIDTTEQVLTNSILALNEENKPKIYFLTGHNEYLPEQELACIASLLKNEAFEYENLNISTTNNIPEDCDILAIMSPDSDIFDIETNIIKDYINKGGELYISQDILTEGANLPNLQLILNEYGVSIDRGYIVELGDAGVEQYPYVFLPVIEGANSITEDLYTDNGKIYMMYSQRLKFSSDEELGNLNVKKEVLLHTTEDARFIKNLDLDINKALDLAEKGNCDIAATMIKTVNPDSEDEDVKESKLVIVASTRFSADVLSPLTQNMPLSLIENNEDFTINSMAYLSDKKYTLTIRKDMSSSTYMPTNYQNRIVIAIILIVPILIIFIGIIVWKQRKKRK